MMRTVLPFLVLFALSVGAADAPGGERKAAEYATPPQFRLLRFGEVRPAGWLVAQMRRDLAEGFAGHLPEIAPRTCGRNIFTTGRNTPSRKSDAGGSSGGSRWWNGETEGNWRTGFTMTTLLAGTPDQRTRLDAMIAELLRGQDADGYLGIYSPELRWKSDKGCGELWTQTCLFRGLLAYYEATERKDVLAAVEKAVRLTIRSYAGKPLANGQHSLMFCDVVERLYDLTGDPTYRDFGVRLCQEMSQRGVGGAGDMTFKTLLDEKQLFRGHAATQCETFRLPAWAACVLADPVWAKARDITFAKVLPQISPTGGPVAQEGFEGRAFNPDLTAYECCTTKEWLVGCVSAVQKTGDAALADRAEDAFFNAVQAARLGDGKGVSYCTKDNQYRLGGEIARRMKLSPCHEDVANCCAPNFSQIAAHFTRNAWMRSGDGLAAVLYAPCELNTRVNDARVRIVEETAYPFSGVIRLTLTPSRDVVFTLRLRVPGWCDDAKATIAGATITGHGPWLLVTRRWRPGEVVELSFAERPRLIPAVNKEFYVRRGPLFYALPIPAETKAIKDYPAAGFHDYHVTPAAGATWDYALPQAGRDAPETAFASREKSAVGDYPWDTAPLRLSGVLFNRATGKVESMELVPMGSGVARLRRCTFPPAMKPM